MVAMNCTAVDIAYTPDDLYRLKREGKKAIMLGIENGYAIGKDISNVERFRKRGVVYMTLCHNGNNDICGSARYNDENLGVSPFGEQVIREMNRVGMMVDLSHAGVQTFYDTLDISQKPVVCSHSSSRALCDHPRNLYDEQLKAIARKGGVVQVCIYDFDGDGGVKGCYDSSELINLTRCLLQERYSEKDIRLIWGENFLRVMRNNQAL